LLLSFASLSFPLSTKKRDQVRLTKGKPIKTMLKARTKNYRKTNQC